jgi:hypothetical protein
MVERVSEKGLIAPAPQGDLEALQGLDAAASDLRGRLIRMARLARRLEAAGPNARAVARELRALIALLRPMRRLARRRKMRR